MSREKIVHGVRPETSGYPLNTILADNNVIIDDFYYLDLKPITYVPVASHVPTARLLKSKQTSNVIV